MVEAALADDPTPIDRVVVTVPASFQVAQRQDTALAMRLAGLEVAGGDLIDEPVAAFLDYLTSGHDEELKITKPKNLLVFDFGGGTCDVAVLRVSSPRDGAGIEVGPRSVSRYHRLGGGDIDRAIVHNELIPALLEENGLGKFDLVFEHKKTILEPSLLDLAESLKEGLCSEIRRLQSFGKYEEGRDGLVRRLPESRTITVEDRELRLSAPSLSAPRFEEILEPFLDTDLLYPTETDYLLLSSIFAPLTGALDRSGLSAKDIDLALLVGGSSLIPQISQAVEAFLPNARVLTHRNRDDVKACVSRGAAYQAMSLVLFGEGLVQPVCAESLAIQTVKGPMELVAAGTPLPYPAGGESATNTDLRVPETSAKKLLDLRVELVSGTDHRKLGVEFAHLEPPGDQGPGARASLPAERKPDARPEGDPPGRRRAADLPDDIREPPHECGQPADDEDQDRGDRGGDPHQQHADQGPEAGEAARAGEGLRGDRPTRKGTRLPENRPRSQGPAEF